MAELPDRGQVEQRCGRPKFTGGLRRRARLVRHRSHRARPQRASLLLCLKFSVARRPRRARLMGRRGLLRIIFIRCSLVFAKCETDKSDQDKSCSGYHHPMRILHCGASSWEFLTSRRYSAASFSQHPRQMVFSFASSFEFSAASISTVFPWSLVGGSCHFVVPVGIFGRCGVPGSSRRRSPIMASQAITGLRHRLAF